MPFTEDTAAFLQVADFATAATWSVGSAVVNVIFDSGYQAAELGAIAGMEGARLTAVVATADMPTAAHGQTLTIASVVYTIRGVQSDGTGMTTLVLAEP